MFKTIEDVLETLAGFTSAQHNIEIVKEEYTIINSIARQVFRGTALTDRQFSLMNEKLVKYDPHFIDAGMPSILDSLNELRKPLRTIDRSKYIKLVDASDVDSTKTDIDSNKYIAVRFPFKKSDIMLINEIARIDGYYHNKGSHIHYFAFEESYLLHVGDKFFRKDFDIDDILKEKYEQIKEIESRPNDYLPFVQDNKVMNIKDSLKEIIEEETNNNLLKVYDRRFRYCMKNINIEIVPTSIEEYIASRKDAYYHSKPSLQSVSDILYGLYNLDRFPLLVVLDNRNLELQLHEVVTFYRDLIPSEQQSVLFRDEDVDSSINYLIKRRKLNNWVDKHTKVVYINSNKLPKVLLEADWTPNCTFAYNSNNNKNVQFYMNNTCDLIVHREETISPFVRMYK
jgi:hypothetical protein